MSSGTRHLGHSLNGFRRPCEMFVAAEVVAETP
jgi:hypothetical protein